VTGTAIDEFTPIYLGLLARGIGQRDADAMDLSVVAAALGVGEQPANPAATDPHAMAQAVNAERIRRAEAAMVRAQAEGRTLTWAEAEAEGGPVSWEDVTPGR
jgi:hypothetical protein